MKRILNTTILLFLLSSLPSKAQDSTNVYNFDFHKVKPIVQIFGTASYNFDENKYEYSFSRAHIGFQYQFNAKWNAKIILDRGRSTSVGKITVSDSAGNKFNIENTSKEGSYYTMWLKFASLQWKVNDKLTLEGGAILQNHYITMERFWGLRYVAQTFQDLYWHIPSSDLGFIAYYKFNKFFSVDAAITNGEGSRVKQDSFGKVKIAGGIDINPSQKIQTRIFYHNKQSGINNSAAEQLLSAFIGYKPTDKSRIGSEFNYMKNLDNTDGLKSYGFSLYTAYHITRKTELFTRFDRLLYNITENTNGNIMGDGNTLMGGLSFAPVKGVKLSMNYQGWLPDDNVKPQNRILFNMEYKF
ncbi:hypothetical protein [Ancylomarina longa]|uniref:Porin n=1 Tax=Ancylomarina longa TaxID=2487017 RepID=A0A434AFD3_9BACT|nr:hypothetical protein [Ancylomarina longa]RUT73121.1 hypothetical protein DLK05_15085 [Ancylomarina longa]